MIEPNLIKPTPGQAKTQKKNKPDETKANQTKSNQSKT
jgi:hypothetical protein